MNLNSLHPLFHSFAGGIFGSQLRGKGGTLSRSLELESAGTRPAYSVAAHIGNGDNGVVKGGLDMGDPL